MKNVPTDLLRTFISVVELRSFTQTAKAQGLTQPAVSAQIKRLQDLLNVELLDKSAPGVCLTPAGEQVIELARRMLSVNDRMVEIASPNSSAQLVRVGTRKDCMGPELTRMLASAREQWPNLRFSVKGAGQRRLLQHLKRDEVDLVITLVADNPEGAARHYWLEQLAWVRGRDATFDLKKPVPLVAYKDQCICHRIAVATLGAAGYASELIFSADSGEALRSAVAAGVGVMLAPRSRVPAELEIWHDCPLPIPPFLYGGVFVRAGNELLDQLADHLAPAMRPSPITPAGRMVFAAPRAALPTVAGPPV